MADESTNSWSGVSGKGYPYSINLIGATFEPVAGNYIYAKKAWSGEWTPLYVGETDNFQNHLTSNHEKMHCIKTYGVTHIHTHTNSNDESIRRKEESDIRDKWYPKCNSLVAIHLRPNIVPDQYSA